jgi:hypothetical protein
MGCRIDAGLKRAEDTLNFLIAVGDVLLGNVLERQRLRQCEKMCRPVIPLQRFGNGFWTGFHAVVAILRSGLWVALASDDRTENTHARHACEIANHVMEVEIHLIQGLLHVLNMLDHPMEQIVAMAQETPELTHGFGGTKRGGKQAITLELLQPSTIKAIGFRAARDILDVPGVDQGHLKAARLKHLKQRNPVDACRFHHNCGDPTSCQPVGETIQITGKGTKFLDWLAIAVRRHTDPMLFSAHIDACGMGMHKGHALGSRLGLRTFVSHMRLQSGFT